MSEFKCEALQEAQAATVFPLVREVLPGLLLKDWLRFTRATLRRSTSAQAGIVVVHRGQRAFPSGMFTWRRISDPAHGTLLVAEHFVAVDVLDPEPLMAALVEELERLAKQLGCTAIRSVLPGEGALAGANLRAAGHSAQGATLLKKLEQ